MRKVFVVTCDNRDDQALGAEPDVQKLYTPLSVSDAVRDALNRHYLLEEITVEVKLECDEEDPRFPLGDICPTKFLNIRD